MASLIRAVRHIEPLFSQNLKYYGHREPLSYEEIQDVVLLVLPFLLGLRCLDWYADGHRWLSEKKTDYVRKILCSCQRNVSL